MTAHTSNQLLNGRVNFASNMNISSIWKLIDLSLKLMQYITD